MIFHRLADAAVVMGMVGMEKSEYQSERKKIG
jgi:hypothetical protein